MQRIKRKRLSFVLMCAMQAMADFASRNSEWRSGSRSLVEANRADFRRILNICNCFSIFAFNSTPPKAPFPGLPLPLPLPRTSRRQAGRLMATIGKVMIEKVGAP